MLSELNDHGFTDTSTTRKLALLQDTIWEIETEEPWPFVEAPSVNLNFDGTSDIATNMPAAFRASLRVKDLVTGRRITPLRLDAFEDQVGINHAQSGDPIYYYFEGSALKFWPIPPSSTGRLKLRYLRVSAAITDTSAESAFLIPPRHHRAIVLGALHKLYLMEDDPELAMGYKALYDEKLKRMRQDLWQQQFDRPDSILVVDPDDYDWDFNYL